MLVTAQIGPIGEEVKVGLEELEPVPQSPGGLCPVQNLFSTASVFCTMEYLTGLFICSMLNTFL